MTSELANAATGLPATLVWSTIAGLGIVTYLIRLSFLGILAGKTIPSEVARFLRFVPVAILPALVAPYIVYPPATGGETDPIRLAAAGAAFVAAVLTKSILAAIAAGMGSLWVLNAVAG
ncbi:MAG: AzlD domain-containing protein [Pseudomonadota bacterium]